MQNLMDYNPEIMLSLVLITSMYLQSMSEERTMYSCTCSDCGKDSKVPFQPKEGRPVYCQECFPKHRN
jgi:CxxC-x17-CxxC domain-containing protein